MSRRGEGCNTSVSARQCVVVDSHHGTDYTSQQLEISISPRCRSETGCLRSCLHQGTQTPPTRSAVVAGLSCDP